MIVSIGFPCSIFLWIVSWNAVSGSFIMIHNAFFRFLCSFPSQLGPFKWTPGIPKLNQGKEMGWFPLPSGKLNVYQRVLTMIPVRSQWGQYNFSWEMWRLHGIPVLESSKPITRTWVSRPWGPQGIIQSNLVIWKVGKPMVTGTPICKKPQSGSKTNAQGSFFFCDVILCTSSLC